MCSSSIYNTPNRRYGTRDNTGLPYGSIIVLRNVTRVHRYIRVHTIVAIATE